MSSPFRRLQGKTQVYPLPHNDFVRNRLTHSIEVSFVGRTIAHGIFQQVRNHVIQGTLPRAFEDIHLIVNASCLIHDIGNPPFGHSGEASIRKFFRERGDNFQILQELKTCGELYNDFLNFDGNAQGFRVAVKNSNWRYRGGMRLSAPVLAAFVKYPFNSSCDYALSKHKFGYFRTEQRFFHHLFSDVCGIPEVSDGSGTYYLHPLATVLEAADDIAYLTSDVEDAYKSGEISYTEAKSVLTSFTGGNPLEAVEEFLDSNGKLVVEGNEDDHISFLRSTAVNTAVEKVSITYKDLIEKWLRTEEFNSNSIPGEKIKLLEMSDFDLTETAIRRFSKNKIYKGRRKMALQVSGGKIIYGLLRIYIEIVDKAFLAYEDRPLEDDDYEEELLGILDKEQLQVFELLPDHIKNRIENVVKGLLTNELAEETLVKASNRQLAINEILHSIIDFVAGMSDEYAVRFYNNINYIDIEDRGGPY